MPFHDCPGETMISVKVQYWYEMNGSTTGKYDLRVPLCIPNELFQKLKFIHEMIDIKCSILMLSGPVTWSSKTHVLKEAKVRREDSKNSSATELDTHERAAAINAEVLHLDIAPSNRLTDTPNSDFVFEYAFKTFDSDVSTPLHGVCLTSDDEVAETLAGSSGSSGSPIRLENKQISKDNEFLIMASRRKSDDMLHPYPRNMVYLFDRTDSMSGKVIEETKMAIIHALKQLSPKDSFALGAFCNFTEWFDADYLEKEVTSRKTFERKCTAPAVSRKADGQIIGRKSDTAVSDIKNKGPKGLVHATEENVLFACDWIMDIDAEFSTSTDILTPYKAASELLIQETLEDERLRERAQLQKYQDTMQKQELEESRKGLTAIVQTLRKRVPQKPIPPLKLPMIVLVTDGSVSNEMDILTYAMTAEQQYASKYERSIKRVLDKSKSGGTSDKNKSGNALEKNKATKEDLDVFLGETPEHAFVIRPLKNKVRTFAFGIGPYVNRHFLQALAVSTGGESACTLKTGEVLQRFLGRTEAPVLSNLSIEFFPKPLASRFVDPLPLLRAHVPYVINGVYDGPAPDYVILEGVNLNGAAVQLELPVQKNPKTSLEKLTAKLCMSELQGSYWMNGGNFRGENSVVPEDGAGVGQLTIYKKRIIDASLTASVTCPFSRLLLSQIATPSSSASVAQDVDREEKSDTGASQQMRGPFGMLNSAKKPTYHSVKTAERNDNSDPKAPFGGMQLAMLHSSPLLLGDQRATFGNINVSHAIHNISRGTFKGYILRELLPKEIKPVLSEPKSSEDRPTTEEKPYKADPVLSRVTGLTCCCCIVGGASLCTFNPSVCSEGRLDCTCCACEESDYCR
jgi:hypothetical protein